MALIISLKAGERIVINGAVIRNGASRRADLHIENSASILRAQDILQPGEADKSPFHAVYFAIQSCLLDPGKSEEMTPRIHDILARSANLHDDAAFDACVAAGTHVSTGHLHKALRALRPIVETVDRAAAPSPTPDKVELAR